ncbi:MAG: ABC transporter substrate-binding protein, partial [Pseudomonadota bacterium]
AHILHPSFTPPFSANPMGTGPYQLDNLAVGERCILKRATETTDGQPFQYWGGEVYLDEIHYYNFDVENQLTAFATGEVDAIDEFGIEQYQLAEALDGAIMQARSSQTVCCRMQVTQPPFDNLKLRQAIQKAVDNNVCRELIFQGNGDTGWNHHVAPVHPEYYELPPLERDVEAAKSLLTEAGYPDGIELTIDVGNTNGPWHQTLAEIIKDQLKDAGITLNINVMPPSKYWEIWNQTPFGATAWTHRPLATMGLSLAYRKGVQWNETNFGSDEFDAALNDAEATLDVEDRRIKMERVEKILQEAAVIVQPVFRPQFTIVHDKVRNYPAHPTRYHQYNEVWLES